MGEDSDDSVTAMVISSVIFMEYILQDMFCGCWGICGIGTGWGG